MIVNPCKVACSKELDQVTSRPCDNAVGNNGHASAGSIGACSMGPPCGPPGSGSAEAGFRPLVGFFLEVYTRNALQMLGLGAGF